MISNEIIERHELKLITSGPRAFKMNVGAPIDVIIAEGGLRGEEHKYLKRVVLILTHNGLEHKREQPESFLDITRDALVEYIKREVNFRPT